MTLPQGHSSRAFWSFTLYDNQTRSMLQTPQRYPRAGSQSYPSPAAEANADGSTTVYFAPKQPEGVKRGNWIQTMPGKGWFTILRLYSPLSRSSQGMAAERDRTGELAAGRCAAPVAEHDCISGLTGGAEEDAGLAIGRRRRRWEKRRAAGLG